MTINAAALLEFFDIQKCCW